MCLGKDSPVKCSTITPVMDGISHTIYQVSKPKLSRKITSTVKLNLNKYWTKFGEIMTSPKKNQIKPSTTVRSSKLAKNLFQSEDENITSMGIQIQDNLLAIEELKKQRFELLKEDGCEIEDNLANEFKEICGVSANNVGYLKCSCY